MFRSTTLALMAAALACALCASVASAHPTEPTVPAKIQVGAGHKPFLLAHAIGVQIYACTATADGAKWQFVAPRAVLYGDHFQFLGTHFAGPTWQTKNGSQVKAARVDGVMVDPTAIPWLLLKATTTTPGRLAHTTYIQRLATRGGLEPAAAACSAAAVGTERHIPYTADYRFWKETA
jgi:Protein of unknown function (DUF3455)